MKENLIKTFGLPEPFGLTLLIIGLILALAPWLSGHDFGIFKIPQFSLRIRKALRILGPIFLIVAIVVHIPIVGPSRQGCSLSGRVFNSLDNQPLSGVIIGFYQYTEDVRKSKQVKFNVATTGLDGIFRADCQDIPDSEFPLRVVLSHPNWKATHLTALKVERGMEKSDINFPVAIRDFDLKFPPPKETPPAQPGPIGTILRIETSEGSRSYDFRTEVTNLGPTEGDFYFSPSHPSFWANNQGQRGIVDLGKINISLDQVTPPQSGYYKFGIPAIVGHVYVSLAREGNEGEYIIFRVLDIQVSDETVQYYEIQYYYRR